MHSLNLINFLKKNSNNLKVLYMDIQISSIMTCCSKPQLSSGNKLPLAMLIEYHNLRNSLKNFTHKQLLQEDLWIVMSTCFH